MLLFALIVLATGANANSLYTKDNEKLIYTFTTKKNKLLAVSVDKNNNYMVYRYGSAKKVELEFPKNKQNSFHSFIYSYYFRGGGAENAGLDLNWLRFYNGAYEYVIYDEYSAESNNWHVGIKLTNTKTSKVIDIKGDPSTRKGSLVDFRFMDNIRKDEFSPE